MVKVYTPPTTNKHQSMACSKQRVPPTYNSPRGVLFNYFDLLWSFWIMGLGIPVTGLSHEWGAESTPPENNPPSMEDIGSPSCNMSCSSIQNRISFEGLEFGTYKFTWNGREIPHIGRYGGLIWNNFGVYGVWMHKQYSRLVQVKASKRLGSDQLRERQQSWTCIKINLHQVQTWVGYNPPWT